MRVVAAFVFLALGAAPALAINLEGHDDWMKDGEPFDALIGDTPLPALEPLPSCTDMEDDLKSNSYEQIPLPGLNCWEEPRDALD